MSESQPFEDQHAVDEGEVYLTLEDVLGLYAELFDCTTIEATDQVRDLSGLEGALARPRAYAAYEGADVATQAAALAHGVAEGQYFVEGNKRVALVAMMTFLRVNGFVLTATQNERATWILDLSAGLTIEELAAKIRAGLVAGEQW